MASNYRNPKRRKEFWEPQDYEGYLGAETAPKKPTPRIDIQALQEQAMYLPTQAYEKGIASLGTRMAKRKMGRSGAYVEGERDEMKKYLLDMPRGDIALQAEQLALQERLGMRGFDIQEQELALKRFLGTEELGIEKERLSMQDRHFESQMELEWDELGLNEQEINDRKEMFYAQQKQLSEQFNREYNLRETEAAWRHQEELSRQDMTQQEIDNEMEKFDQQLLWEKEHYGMVLDEEQRQWNDDIAFRLKQLTQTGDLEIGKLNETMRQFDEEMTRLKELDTFEMDMQQRGFDLEEIRVMAEVERENIKVNMMNNEIFGSWDEGFGPDGFTGDHYLKNPDGSYQLDEQGNPIVNPQWDAYMTEHYHKGALDLREWELQIMAALGMVGVIPGEEEEPEPEPTKLEDIRTEIKDLGNQLSTIQSQMTTHPGNPDINAPDMISSQDRAAYDALMKQLKDLKTQIKSLKDDEQAWIDEAIAGYTPGGG